VAGDGALGIDIERGAMFLGQCLKTDVFTKELALGVTETVHKKGALDRREAAERKAGFVSVRKTGTEMDPIPVLK
jgi:hypothetical protein